MADKFIHLLKIVSPLIQHNAKKHRQIDVKKGKTLNSKILWWEIKLERKSKGEWRDRNCESELVCYRQKKKE